MEEEGGSGWGIAGGGEDDKERKLERVWESKEEKGREICPKCKVRVNSGERGVICDLCNRWHHSECEGVTKKEYDKIVEIDDKVRWYCKRCDLKIDDIVERNRLLAEENEIMKKRIGEQMEKIRKEYGEMIKIEVSKINQDLKRKFVQMMDEFGKKSDLKLKEMKREMEELKKMKKEPNIEKMKEMEEEIEELKKIKKDPSLGKLKEMSRDIEELKKGKVDQNLEKCDIVLKRDLEEVRREMVTKGVEEMRKEKKEEEKKIEVIEVRMEEIEKERRKKNLMIFNLRESEQREAADRYREDEENLRMLLTEDVEVKEVTSMVLVSPVS